MHIIYLDKRLCSVFNCYLISIPLTFRVDLLRLKGEALSIKLNRNYSIEWRSEFYSRQNIYPGTTECSS